MYPRDYENKQRFQPESTIEADLREQYKSNPVALPTTSAQTPAPQTTTSAPTQAPISAAAQRQNALNQSRANDAAGISNISEPENP